MKVKRVLDLFCGIGGLGAGFSQSGFRVLGVDIDRAACETYRLNLIGETIQADLTREEMDGDYDIVIGGPPCAPWSILNLRKRGKNHPAYSCMRSFFKTVLRISPDVFVMENVPFIRKDELFLREVRHRGSYGYNVSYRVISYSQFGAATSRRRLFTVGFLRELRVDPNGFFDMLPRRPAKKVMDVIGDLRTKDLNPSIDHVWPRVSTISKYLPYYRTGRFGWYVLKWDRPAPSFGNISKTYILHPDSFNGGVTRPISVREALRIMGFSDSFKITPSAGLSRKYQMIADAVSPVFSRLLAEAIKKLLT